MDMILLGQLLLGLLAAVAILVNIRLARLGLRYRKRHQLLAPIFVAMLFWLPVLSVALVAGGVALGEISLLSYHPGQDLGRLSWFMIGAGLSIFADTCTAFIWMNLREVLKMTETVDDWVAVLAALASQDDPLITERNEE